MFHVPRSYEPPPAGRSARRAARSPRITITARRMRPVVALLPTLLALCAAPLCAQRPEPARPAVSPGDSLTLRLGLDRIPRRLTLPFLAADSTPVAATLPDLLPGAVQRYADLGIEVDGRTELGGEWTRFRPCDPTSRLPCDPGALPQLRPRLQLGIRARGTVSDRVHVDVDYDQRREFGAANTVNLYYQGLAGEFLRRVEVGDVSFALPPSRYLTQGVPGGNFGLRAQAASGPLSIEAVLARQKGDVTTRDLTLGGAGGGVAQDTDVGEDDADYVKGQFFFVVDPRLLAGYPRIDALGIDASAAPASERPAAGGAIVVYRDERRSTTSPEQQAQLGYFLAEATTAGGEQRHSGLFRRLTPGTDYLLHSSGLWIVLRSPLRADEALAIGYVTETGDTVGALIAPERGAGAATPTLRLLRPPEAQHRPGLPSWEYEMHQVYRIDASSAVDPAQVELQLSLGQPGVGGSFVVANGEQVPLLRLFGLDEEAPLERLDASRIYQPDGGSGAGLLGSGVAGVGGIGAAAGSGLGGTGDVRVTGTFLVLPTLRPFAEPPATATLSAADAAAALGAQANPAIYDEADPAARDAAARFRLTFRYRVPVDADGASFSLGALGVREGSERITLGDRTLRRGIDYAIDYDLGTLTLSNPAALAGAGGPQQLHATFEQKASFDVAPTTLAGLTARWTLGDRGELSVVGLYRAQQALQTRPQLGLEPASLMLGGLSGSIELGGAWLDRLIGAVTGAGERGGDREGEGNGQSGAGGFPAPAPAQSSLRLSGELAASLPDPNTRGATWLDDFEATDALPLSLSRVAWDLGSAPVDATGATAELPASPGAADAAPLVWQHEFTQDGQVVGARTAASIDSLINVAGAAVREPVLYLTFGGAPAAPDGTSPSRLWRSVTTVLGASGRDLSRTEYLEFYAAAPDGRDLSLVLDLGTVSEDALYLDATGATSGLQTDGHAWGLGVLDEEARLREGEVWGTEQDARGLWDGACTAEPGRAYPLGDPLADCPRRNGLIDTEDLDGDGFLQAVDGPHLRWVVPLERMSRYLVRDRAETRTGFRLYRVPLRNGLELAGAGAETLRDVRELRVTITGRPGDDALIQLARLRLIGSRWTKRRGDGVLRGIVGDDAGAGIGATAVRVGVVSRVTEGAAYASPPGVRDELQDPSAAYGVTGIEHDEKSLRVAFDALEPGDRAEAYFRWPQQARNLLAYRELRLWAVAARADAAADLRLVVKVGTDERNYYLWQSKLRSAVRRGRERRRLAARARRRLRRVVPPARGRRAGARAPRPLRPAARPLQRRQHVRRRAAGPRTRAEPRRRPRADLRRLQRRRLRRGRRGLARRAAAGRRRHRSGRRRPSRPRAARRRPARFDRFRRPSRRALPASSPRRPATRPPPSTPSPAPPASTAPRGSTGWRCRCGSRCRTAGWSRSFLRARTSASRGWRGCGRPAATGCGSSWWCVGRFVTGRRLASGRRFAGRRLTAGRLRVRRWAAGSRPCRPGSRRFAPGVRRLTPGRVRRLTPGRVRRLTPGRVRRLTPGRVRRLTPGRVRRFAAGWGTRRSRWWQWRIPPSPQTRPAPTPFLDLALALALALREALASSMDWPCAWHIRLRRPRQRCPARARGPSTRGCRGTGGRRRLRSG